LFIYVLIVLIQYQIYACFINFIVFKEQYDNTLSEAANNTCQPKNNYDDMVQQQINSDELLITCVARKQALFDYRILASERTNLKKKHSGKKYVT